MWCSLEPNTYTSHKMDVPFKIVKQFSEISGKTLLSWNAQSNSYRALRNRSQVCVQITAVLSPINETMDSFCLIFLCMSSLNVFLKKKPIIILILKKINSSFLCIERLLIGIQHMICWTDGRRQHLCLQFQQILGWTFTQWIPLYCKHEHCITFFNFNLGNLCSVTDKC